MAGLVPPCRLRSVNRTTSSGQKIHYRSAPPLRNAPTIRYVLVEEVRQLREIREHCDASSVACFLDFAQRVVRSGGTRVSPRRGLLCALWIEICEDLSPLRRSHFETARGFAAIWNSIL
jgi:hypothetical protein